MTNNFLQQYLRWLIFVALSVFLIIDIFFIGLIFKLLNNEFLLIMQAIIAILTAIIIRFMPNIDMFKLFIFESKWKYYLIPLILTIIVFAATSIYIWMTIFN